MWRGKKTGWISWLASIRRAKPGADMVQAVWDVYAFNKSLRESQAAGLVAPITAETVQRSRSFKPQKKTLLWEQNQLD